MVEDTQIISAITELSRRQGYPPTFRELARQVGLRSPSTIHGRLEKLRRAGQVDWMPRQPRTLRVVDGVPNEPPTPGMAENPGAGEKSTGPGEGAQGV